MTSTVVQELILEGRLDRVAPNPKQSSRMLRSCTQHLETADERSGADPSGCYALLYDAARKAVAAHMLFHGIRPTSRPGAHAAVVMYAEAHTPDHSCRASSRNSFPRRPSQQGRRPNRGRP